jgi:hypothetical protein
MSQSGTQIETGSYAVTTVYSMPWSKKTTTTNSKAKRTRVDKKIQHEIFEECSKITQDPYWTGKLKDCARNKFPRGFSYKNGMLIHRRGNKVTRKLIPNIPAEALSICLSFFKSEGGIMSANDRKTIQKEEENRLLSSINDNELTWKDIKTPKIKELLISEYISELADRMGFDKQEKMELSTTIKSGFMLKYFNSKNVNMKDGKISDIDGLVYDKNKNYFYIDTKLTNKRPGRKVKGLGIEKTYKKPKVSFMSNWEKYLQNIEKRNINRGSNFQVIESSKSNSISHSGDLFLSTVSSNDQGSNFTYSNDSI